MFLINRKRKSKKLMMSIYLSRSFPRSNSSFFLCSGNAFKSEVLRLKEEMFLVNAGLGTPIICMQDEPTGVSINRATRFENKVGSLDRVAGKSRIKKRILKRFFIDRVAGKSRIKKHILERFFIELVAGKSRIKERAAARFHSWVGSTDVVAGEPLLLPRRFRKNGAWMELNKIRRTQKKVKGFLFQKIKGGYFVAIAGFLCFFPFRCFRKRFKNTQKNDRLTFTIERIPTKTKRHKRKRINIGWNVRNVRKRIKRNRMRLVVL